MRGVLGEFRTALRDEIYSAQRSSSSNAVPLTNGRKIGQVGAAFQYAFTVDSVLNMPGDAPDVWALGFTISGRANFGAKSFIPRAN